MVPMTLTRGILVVVAWVLFQGLLVTAMFADTYVVRAGYHLNQDLK